MGYQQVKESRAPVCGLSVRCRPVRIFTSMRNIDSLEKRMSSFF